LRKTRAIRTLRQPFRDSGVICRGPARGDPEAPHRSVHGLHKATDTPACITQASGAAPKAPPTLGRTRWCWPVPHVRHRD